MAQTDIRPRHLELGLSDDDVLGMYRAMLLARGVDERMWLMQRAGKIAFIISGQGHEGAQVATAVADAQGAGLDGAVLSVHRQRHDVRHERRGHHHRPPRQGR